MTSSDDKWMNWMKVSHKIVLLMKRNASAEALDEIDRFLSTESVPELRSDALGYKAELREQSGDFEAAISELHHARSLIGPTYLRYVHELRLGDLQLKHGDTRNATNWYWTALRTCFEGEGISGGNALQAVLRMQGGQEMTQQERELFANVVQRSWRLLGLSGDPNLPDAALAVAKIRQAEVATPVR